jgi:hypothetical protein
MNLPPRVIDPTLPAMVGLKSHLQQISLSSHHFAPTQASPLLDCYSERQKRGVWWHSMIIENDLNCSDNRQRGSVMLQKFIQNRRAKGRCHSYKVNVKREHQVA